MQNNVFSASSPPGWRILIGAEPQARMSHLKVWQDWVGIQICIDKGGYCNRFTGPGGMGGVDGGAGGELNVKV